LGYGFFRIFEAGGKYQIVCNKIKKKLVYLLRIFSVHKNPDLIIVACIRYQPKDGLLKALLPFYRYAFCQSYPTHGSMKPIWPSLKRQAIQSGTAPLPLMWPRCTGHAKIDRQRPAYPKCRFRWTIFPNAELWIRAAKP
jgi:hypothetical protein